MRVRLDIGLDFDGNHSFEWSPSDGQEAVDVPKSTLDRWTAEREAFTVAFLRWKRVIDEIEETLYKAEQSRRQMDEGVAVAAPAVARRR